jgi:hypothetical protein
MKKLPLNGTWHELDFEQGQLSSFQDRNISEFCKAGVSLWPEYSRSPGRKAARPPDADQSIPTRGTCAHV